MEKIVITISNDIRININSLPQLLINTIIKNLTILNPMYLNAKRLGKYTGNIEKYITFYQVEGDLLILPRGYVRKLVFLLNKAGLEYIIDNKVITLPSVNVGSKIVPRSYQKPAIEAIVKGIQGGIVGGCGSGKTQIMLEAMARISQPSLWITHTQDLLKQVIDRACQCFDIKLEEIGVIANGKVSIGSRLTVALVQTLSKVDISEIADKFGAIFIDEGHHLATNQFYNTVGQFPARYRIWCTATPERGDGLSEIIFLTGGEILHTIDDNELPTISPELVIVDTEYNGNVNPDDYPGMLTTLINNTDRNNLIVDVIANEAPGHYSLVLSDRIAHLDILKDMLTKRLPGMQIEILTGTGMTTQERTSLMERAKAGQIDILLATKLAREGLDLPNLDRLFLVTPKKNSLTIEQEVGRIRRPCANKQDAIVYDFWDTQNPILKVQFWTRKKAYEKIGMIVDLKDGVLHIKQKNAG